MPTTTIRGAEINYEVLGQSGPWVALSPGGRRPLADGRAIAQKVANAGYRVLVHDRRNCGASDVSIDGPESEYDMWADDLHALLGQLGALPAIVGGSSSGCRLALLLALRHPGAARALLLWRVTGGAHACTVLAEQYYGQFIKAAERGGMAAVCELDSFKDAVAAKASNRDRLMAMNVRDFIAAMERWRGYFERGKEQPIVGVSEADLRSITLPTCIIAGNDQRHPRRVAERAQRLIANSELHEVLPERPDVDMVPVEEWLARMDDVAKIFVGFLDRALVKA
jgi:pimeloyl-ACP methyl ester carboxylesterase